MNYVYTLLKKEGFAKLPRRSADIKPKLLKIEAPKSKALELKAQTFNSNNVALLSFMVLLKKYKISQINSQHLYFVSAELLIIHNEEL